MELRTSHVDERQYFREFLLAKLRFPLNTIDISNM